MKNRFLISFLFIGTIVLFAVMRWHGKPLTQTPTSRTGIVALELAKNKQTADEITAAWSNAGLQQHAVDNTYIDFIFIFFYSLFLFSANWLFSIGQTSIVKKSTQFIALFALTAGLLDISENFFLLKMLHHHISDAEAAVTWWLATLKFILAAIAFLNIVLSLMFFLFRKPKPSSL